MNGVERRMFQVSELRVARRDGGGATIVGYAAVFDKLSVDLFGFREKVAPGAFAESIAAGDDVRALWNHDPNIVLGRTKSGTLRLAEDETGLRVEIDTPDTQQARDLVAVIERGDVDQMSFAFRTLKDKWQIDGEEQYVRTLLQVKLYDVSPATYPAYPDTSMGVRAAPGTAHPVYGEIPEIPADVRQAPASAADSDQVQARLAVLRRRLEIATK